MKPEKTILLVEDDENDVLFLKRALSKIGWAGQLRVAKDGGDAMAYLEGRGQYSDRAKNPVPTLVLLDLNLPVKNGLEVLKWFRTYDPDRLTPVIVFTSSTSDVDVREAYRFGANSYLNKPVVPEGLIEVMKLVQNYWVGHNILLPTGPQVAK